MLNNIDFLKDIIDKCKTLLSVDQQDMFLASLSKLEQGLEKYKSEITNTIN